MTKRCADRGRAGGGPTLLECMTMRMMGHSVHDPAKYVPPGLLEEWARKDPVRRYESYLLRHRVLTPADVKDWDARFKREVDEAVEWAEASAMPEPEDAARGVWAEDGPAKQLH